MGCGNCRKRQKRKIAFDPNDGKGSVQKQLTDLSSKGLTMIQSFAISMASRGLKNKKVDKPVKQLRILSCFGNNNIEPCQHLKKSSTRGKFYCDECGCGDKKRTWLLSTENEYSKLDYPKLNCPLGMPGFTNYSTTSNNERKQKIEQINIDDLVKIPLNILDI
tara:strand:- start:58 stop:546 length:489 start_codon:yes stop_codon:yes gene_type:complete